MGCRKPSVSNDRDISVAKYISKFNFYSPQNAKKLFNLRHASLRNVIERVFGVIKKRFPMLVIAPMYPICVQIDIFLAIIVLHNFIRMSGKGDDEILLSYVHDQSDVSPEDLSDSSEGLNVPAVDKAAAEQLRDAIANHMWREYQAELRRRKR